MSKKFCYLHISSKYAATALSMSELWKCKDTDGAALFSSRSASSYDISAPAISRMCAWSLPMLSTVVWELSSASTSIGRSVLEPRFWLMLRVFCHYSTRVRFFVSYLCLHRFTLHIWTHRWVTDRKRKAERITKGLRTRHGQRVPWLHRNGDRLLSD